MFKKIKAEDLGKILLVNEKNGIAMMLTEALTGVSLFREEEAHLEEKAAGKGAHQETETEHITEEKPLEKPKQHRIDRGKVMALARGKWTVQAIAKEMHSSEQTVRNIIADLKKEGNLDGEQD